MSCFCNKLLEISRKRIYKILFVYSFIGVQNCIPLIRHDVYDSLIWRMVNTNRRRRGPRVFRRSLVQYVAIDFVRF